MVYQVPIQIPRVWVIYMEINVKFLDRYAMPKTGVITDARRSVVDEGVKLIYRYLGGIIQFRENIHIKYAVKAYKGVCRIGEPAYYKTNVTIYCAFKSGITDADIDNAKHYASRYLNAGHFAKEVEKMNRESPLLFNRFN